jgi:hypothetical protein
MNGKRAISLIIGLILAAGSTFAAQAGPAAGKFDFSAIDRLWKIVAVLESDREPADEEWEGLVRTPGYSALIAHEGSYGLAFLKRNLRLVFKPSQAGELEKANKSRAALHFLDLKAKKAALMEFQSRLQNPAVASEALDLLRPWLPDKSIEKRSAPTAAFIIFDRDARGGYGPLIFDLLYAFDQGDAFKFLYAHESSHYFHRELAAYDSGNVRQSLGDVLFALSMIPDEGMADQIDKPTVLFGNEARVNSDYGREYKKNMIDSPRILGALDRLLCRLEESPAEANRISGEMFGAIPQSGHPTGYFMTRAILDDGGKAELIRTFNNPFAFYYLYNAAALRNPELPRLSNGAITALRNLEKQIIPAPETGLSRAAMFSGVDLSVVASLQKITAILAEDKEPEAALWDGFFSNPGYRTFFALEGDSRTRLQNAISLAFKPGRAAELQQAIDKGSNTLKYMLQYKNNAAAVVQACERFRTDRAFEKAVEQVHLYLSGKSSDILADATIALIFLGSADVRPVYEPMLIDPLDLWSSAEKMAKYIRLHLISHHLDKIRPYDSSMLTRRQATFLDAWETIQCRGLADLLTRLAADTSDPESMKRYDLRAKDVPRLLAEMDRIMSRAADDSKAWTEFEALQRDLFIGLGCPVGQFMAGTILDVLGRETLAETTGNPPAFLRAYRKAALKKGGRPAFSDQSVAYLAKLESEALAGTR